MPTEQQKSGAEAKLALRIKSKKSQNAVLRDLSTKATMRELLEKLANLTGVAQDQIALLKGFPPRRISYDIDSNVESLGLQNQDTLIVEADTSGNPSRGDDGSGSKTNESSGTSQESPESRKENNKAKGSEQSNIPVATPQQDSEPTVNNGPSYSDLIPNSEEQAGLLLRQIVPSDNSCLFTSVTYCLSGELQRDAEGGSSFLREMIANTVESDPGRYTEAMLGRPNSDYVDWIKKPESWGGGIELAILAEFYGLQISVVDTQSLHISCFGEDQNFTQRMFLIYDGIHYDPLYYEPFTGGSTRTIFDVTDERMTELAIQLAREAKASNQFTDVKNFALRCQVCNKLLKGENEAQEHAKKTAHTSFAEIKKT